MPQGYLLPLSLITAKVRFPKAAEQDAVLVNSEKLAETHQKAPASHSKSSKKTRCSLPGLSPMALVPRQPGSEPEPERLQIGLIRSEVPSGLASDTSR